MRSAYAAHMEKMMPTRPEAARRITGILRDPELRSELIARAESGVGFSKIDEFNLSRSVIADTLKSDKALDRFARRGISEAIVLREGRPVLLVQNNTFQLPQVAVIRRQLAPAKAMIERALASVGRVEVFDHPDYQWLGTAWVVAEDVVVTNRHVAAAFAKGTARGYVFRRNPIDREMAAQVDFREEFNDPRSNEIKVEQVVYMEKDEDSPDIAFMRLEKTAALPPPIPLCERNPDAQSWVAVVGYPAWDGQRNDSSVMNKVFGDIYDVKRLAPGIITGYRNDVLLHDASTLGGNSGSVVLDAASGAAAALHFAGSYAKMNYALSAQAIRRYLKRIGKGHARLKVTPVSPRTDVQDMETRQGRTRPLSYYKSRRGYDRAFLGSRYLVNLPGIPPGVKTAAVHGTTDNVLRYEHFSVVMSKARRLPFYSAVNIDGLDLRKIIRKGEDAWYFDPRMDEGDQLGIWLYKNNSYDLGHMTRREDPNWGTVAVATRANDDTFHYANASPQHEDLNQKDWARLEDYILAGAKGFRVCVLTGPVLADDDPEYRGVQIARRFWKVAAIVNDRNGRLSATGYLLTNPAAQEFVYGAFKTYQVLIADIEKATGLRFGALKSADPLVRRNRGIEALPGSAVGIEITGPSSLVL